MWRKLSLAKKIWISFTILVLGYMFTVAMSVRDGLTTVDSLTHISKSLFDAAQKSQLAVAIYKEQMKFYNDVVMTGDEGKIAEANANSESLVNTLEDIVHLEGIDPEQKRHIRTIVETVKKFSVEAGDVYIKLGRATEEFMHSSGEEMAKGLATTDAAIKSRLENLSGYFSEQLRNEISTINEQNRRQIRMNVLVFLVVVVFSLLFVWLLISRSVTNPIKDAVRMIKDVADGDLTRHFQVRMQDEIGELVESLNQMVTGLREIVHMVMETTNMINGSANEISASVEEQAAIASEQSASVAEITSTMEELSVSSTQVAGHSNQVTDIAVKSLQSTKEGAVDVERVMAKMKEINIENKKNIKEIVDLGRKSAEITKVMEIINNVADQTKLIAFNAALEASSAGEAGKRFGVVAAEIRRLADSVMESTSETESKINEIQEAVNHIVIASEKGSKGIQEGLDSSTQTAAKLAGIVEGAQATVDAARHISLSTQQAKIASEQVVRALREIAQGANQNSESIQQINLISKDLTRLAADLKSLIDNFKIEEAAQAGKVKGAAGKP